MGFLRASLLLFAVALVGCAQPPTAATLPTDGLLSEPGPTFRIDDNQLPGAADADRLRRPAVHRSGQHPADQPANSPVAGGPDCQGASRRRDHEWRRAAGGRTSPTIIRCFKPRPKLGATCICTCFPTLGNHEFHGDPQRSLENWWNAFPEMRNRRWYSAQLGSRIYLLALDSDTSLAAGQRPGALDREADRRPAVSIDFVIVTLHHPPVADIQQHIEVDHNPRPNEIALRDYLSKAAPDFSRQFSGQRGTYPQLRAPRCGRRDVSGLRRWRGAALFRGAHAGRPLQEHACSPTITT